MVGTSARMKNGKEWMLRAGGIKVVVHPPIQSKGGDAQELCDESYKLIKESLVKYS
jgi:1-acyl-sn-glycerol-3-phosphate acyltransferase